MNKINWSTLKKEDKLYLLIPILENDGTINYIYQESQVINIHHYNWCVNIRFKYTNNNGKRQRIELCVNKLKFDYPVVNISKETGWARDNEINFGDILVSFEKDNLKIIFRDVINNTIDLEYKRIESIKNNINNLKKSYEKLFGETKI